MRTIHFLLAAVLLSFSLSATATATAPVQIPPENGAWTGRIGDSKVITCFMNSDDPAHTNSSSYVYLRHLKHIRLTPDQSSKNTWLEGDPNSPTGIWTFDVQPNRISGTWTNPQKTRTLPIVLDRFKSIMSSYVTGCPDEVFGSNALPQTHPEKITSSKEKTLNGRRYRVLSALGGAVTSAELIGEGQTIATLNTQLMNELRIGVWAYQSCPTAGELRGEKRKNEKPDYNTSTEPVFWNAQWISFVSINSSDCGGAHPFSSTSYSTRSLLSGNEINLWNWIRNSKKEDASPQYDSFFFNYSAPAALNKIITRKFIKQRLALNLKEAHEENGCLDTIRTNSEYKIHLGRKGLVFSPSFPDFTKACEDDIEIPYGELMPFLTKSGRDAVQVIQQSGTH